MRKNYSKEQQSEIIKLYSSGNTVTELSNRYGIARSTIYSWLNDSENKKLLNRKINMRDVFDLKQKCEQQEMMIEILKNAPCTVSSPLQERYAYIQSIADKYSINLLCKAMNVAKGSYYNHVLRNKNEDTLFAQKKAELTPIIEKIFHDNNQIFGAGKIHAILKDRGYKVAAKTVADIMHENGWFAVGTSAKKIYLMTQERKQNILNQQFTVSRPNEVWVSDITYFRYNDFSYYICVILDLYARRVVAHKISLKNSTQLTKSTFKLAYEYRQPTELLFHSDRGTNYTSNTFRDYLRALGVKQSFSNTATPYNNSVMESFFKSMKTERLYRTNYRSERELRESVREYINYYNNDRPHSVLRYQTPEYFESKYYRSIGVYKESESNTDGSNLEK